MIDILIDIWMWIKIIFCTYIYDKNIDNKRAFVKDVYVIRLDDLINNYTKLDINRLYYRLTMI